MIAGCFDPSDVAMAEGSGDSTSDESSGRSTSFGTMDGEATAGTASTSADPMESGSATGPGDSSSPNADPHALADTYLAGQDESLAIASAAGLLRNDIDPDGDALQVIASAPSSTREGGEVEVQADGSFAYAPPPASWWGEDSFTYEVSDERGGTAIGEVRVMVRPKAIPLGLVAGGTGGFSIDGQVPRDSLGFSVSGAGDVNGDGLADLIVGAPGAEPDPTVATDAGRSYVVFGKAGGETVSLNAVAGGTGGFVIDGQTSGDSSGISVSGAGDVNGDGLADLLVGAYNADPAAGADAGRSYVVFGKAGGEAVSLAAIAGGTGGFVIEGEASGDLLGISVSGAGDVNGDGLADLIVGAPGADPPVRRTDAGRSYVVFGKPGGEAVSLAAIAGGTGGFVIDGQAYGGFAGFSVSGAGDVNGDGLADLIVGAYRESPGRSYVVFGKAGGEAVSLPSVAGGAGGFVINGEVSGDNSGRSVSGAGDVNGDGLGDLIVGAHRAVLPAARSYAGRSYVVFGKAGGEAVSLAVVAGGTGGFAIDGEASDDNSGRSVSEAGDVNGDGFADLIVGALQADPATGSSAGRSYVVFGKAGGDLVSLAAVASGTGGFAIDGEASDDFSGLSVSGAGDVNGDRFADVIVGAPTAEPPATVGAGTGKSYVVFGGDFSLSATFLDTP